MNWPITNTKKDPVYSRILDEVRQGCPSKDSINYLRKRIIIVSVEEKYKQLCESWSHPACLLQACKVSKEHNFNILSILGAKLESFTCLDEIDETNGTHKWSEKGPDALKKANSDCNLTSGLEAELTIAVGAGVMLRRNTDTKHGLVNGSIGTVTAITHSALMSNLTTS